MQEDRIIWDGEWEGRVEKLYDHGVAQRATLFSGFLSTGLWPLQLDQYPNFTAQADYVAASEAMVNHFCQHLNIDRGHFLEGGPGLGGALRIVKQYGPARTTAIDCTYQHVLATREAASLYGLENSKVYHGSIRNMHVLDNESIDAALFIESVGHCPRQEFLNELTRVLKPGGRAGIADFALLREPKGFLEASLVKLSGWGWRVPPENRVDVQSYEALLCDYRVIDKREVSSLTIDQYAAHRKIPEVRKSISSCRGPGKTIAGLALDKTMTALHQTGLLGYILLVIEKNK